MYIRPYNKTADRLKPQLLKTVKERLSKNPDDKSAIKVKRSGCSKWMLNEMHSLGLSESYHWVSNYKYCCISRNVNVKIQ